MEYNKSLVSGSVAGALVKFAVPVLLAHILPVIYQATDLFFIGRYATQADMSGVTISAQLMTLVTLGLSGLTTAVTVLLGRYSGAKSEEDMKKTIGACVVFFAVLSAVITAALLAANRAIIVDAMNTQPEDVEAARSYLYICSGGVFFIVGYQLLGAVFRGLGNSKAPLLFAAVACALNIALDALLVVWLQMGASGVAIATVAAQGAALIFAVLFFRRRGLPLARRDMRLSAPHIRAMLKIGLPISVQEILVTMTFIIITAIANDMGVTESVGITERLLGFLNMPAMAMAAAVAAMAAHNIGAGERGRALKCMWISVAISLAIALAANILTWFSGGFLTSLFTKKENTDIIRNAALYLKTYALDCIGIALIWNMNAFFSACGYSLFAMLHSLVTSYALRVPLAYYFSGLEGATLLHLGIGAPVTSAASIVICLAFLFYLKRKWSNSGGLTAASA